MIYRKGHSGSTAAVPEWILVLSGCGMVLGLATYGYNIIRAIGVKLIKVTASRGFAIELGAAIVIILGSQYGIPLSTTHCQVGATVGVGLNEGIEGINVTLLLKVIGGWIITLVVVGVTAAAFFAQGAFAPSIGNLRTIEVFERAVDAGILILGSGGFSVEGKNLSKEVEGFTLSKTDDSQRQLDLLRSLLIDVNNTCSSPNL